MNENDDPTKAPEFNRVVDHFLTTKPKHHAPTKAKPKGKERPASKGRVRKGKSRT